ncbi:MAG: DNA translocase FtsK 4TM domain-containing protein [Alphaproteobacteria bacterium]|nr:DNA translocase FtsK 4TM domain-containing protein [Alphaproteobacteria bacterium]
MTQTSNAHGKAPILPRGLSDFVRRRAVETLGLGVLIVAIGFALSLLSYAPEDPNFNNATGRAHGNLLGLPGAYGAEYSLQTIGAMWSCSPGRGDWSLIATFPDSCFA